MLPQSLRARLLVAFLIVVAVSLGTVAAAVLLIGPQYFAEAMGHMPGDPMGAAMAEVTQVAFADAMRQALLAATVIAIVASTILSLAVAARIARPISVLVAASRRIARGHYAERVPVEEPTEFGELAASFNDMADSLEATERRRLQLVGDIAHDLRTPLTTLDGYLEGLEDGVIAPTADTWHLLRSETGRLNRLIADLSELWRAEARQLTLRLQAVDVAAVAAETVERFAPLSAPRNIRVEVTATPVVARADRDRVLQILGNYLSNAIRLAPDSSTITVTATTADGRVRLAVTDHGPGLAQDQLEAVFERFYRVDPARSRSAGGSGIGLSIVRALAGAIGGRAWAESAGPGTGATFFVELPAA
ncbi:MAG TPA: HAMP domain-containing sensor histidine kinase [Candidatus Saccharimonadales bacterium]|nr:HAMP domain-containing sensor histidine kinase [Candidatus Saccharimonadales bacterium]